MEGGGTEEFLITFCCCWIEFGGHFLHFFSREFGIEVPFFSKQNKVFSFVSMDSIADFFLQKN